MIKRKPVSFNLDERVIEYFKKLADETGLGYQGLINFMLLHAVKMQWRPDVKKE